MKTVLIYALLISFIAFACDEEKVIQKKETDSVIVEILPDQISSNVEVFFVDSSFTKAVLKAKRARVYQAQMETLLDGGINVEFMSKQSGKRVSVLTADSARIDDKTKDMLAGGNVIVISDSSGTKLETSLLEWSHETQKLYSTEYVKITSPTETIQGYGFESDQNLSNYKIFKVSGEQRQQ
ncbi:LPS export ABC transporter periplasmic protein LptC [Bacteroidota bacterium]